MERLTTDHPMGNFQNCLNLFYAKDGEAWVRGGGPEPLYKDVRLHDYIRQAIRNTVDENRTYIDESSDEELGEGMLEWFTDGNSSVEGLIGTLYTAAWAFAELRARLKDHEDAEADGRLVQYVPGNVVYDRFGMEWTVKSAEIHKIGGKLRQLYRCGHIGTDDYRALYDDEILTREEAEAVRKEGKGNA